MSSFIPAVRFACAIILAALCPAATAATFTVTTSTESGAGSLRQAILDANANGDATTDTIVFSIPGTAPITIQPLSALPYVLGRTVIDGTTQPGYNPGTGVPAIELDGSLQPYNTGNGLELGGSAGSNVVKALTINRFTGQAGFVYGYGVHVTGHGCLIQGCFVGTNSAGTADAGNESGGIRINLRSYTQIGGPNPGDGNLISGNGRYGVENTGSISEGTIIQGNKIGTDISGTTVVVSGTYIYLNGVGFNANRGYHLVGGPTISTRNIIARRGIVVGNGTPNVTIQNNYIGTDITGTVNLGLTGDGIGLQGPNALVLNNVIAGGDLRGINVNNNTGGTIIRGNKIGTDVTGTQNFGCSSYGVEVLYPGIVVGGPNPGDGNLISGNGTGVTLDSNCTLQGNLIGTDITGTVAIPNDDGVYCFGSGNTIGGTLPGARNVISGNSGIGVYVRFSTSVNNVVQGNLIGTDITGTAAVGNGGNGVVVQDCANNLIGGDTAAARNVISGNANGVYIGQGGGGSRIQGNHIGTDITGNLPIPNSSGSSVSGMGVRASQEAAGFLIGGTNAGEGNVIAFNLRAGVRMENGSVFYAATSQTAILRNSIFGNGGLGIDLAVTGVTANDALDPDLGGNESQNFPVLSSVDRDGLSDTRIIGSLNSKASTNYRIEFFSNPSGGGDPSGYGEGKTYLGFTNVTTDGSGSAPFNVVLPVFVPAGSLVTATATDPLNNTSEFGPAFVSAPVGVSAFSLE